MIVNLVISSDDDQEQEDSSGLGEGDMEQLDKLLLLMFSC